MNVEIYGEKICHAADQAMRQQKPIPILGENFIIAGLEWAISGGGFHGAIHLQQLAQIEEPNQKPPAAPPCDEVRAVLRMYADNLLDLDRAVIRIAAYFAANAQPTRSTPAAIPDGWGGVVSAPPPPPDSAKHLRDCEEADRSLAELQQFTFAEDDRYSDEKLRELWRGLGGDFHGPNIETGTMPESVLLPWLRGIAVDADRALEMRDMLEDAHQELHDIRAAIGVPYEPHQHLRERTLERCEVLAACDKYSGIAEMLLQLNADFSDEALLRIAAHAGVSTFTAKEKKYSKVEPPTIIVTDPASLVLMMRAVMYMGANARTHVAATSPKDQQHG